jgi:hypothetical protein
MDGLPSMKTALEVGENKKVEPIKKMVGPLAPRNKRTGGGAGVATGTVVIVAMLSLVLGVLLASYGRDTIDAVAPTSKLVFPSLHASSLSFDSLPILGSYAKK